MKPFRLGNAFVALCLSAVLCAAAPVRACLNDRDSDSLAQEAKGLPDVVRVLTGRFERNPPLFYQMREKRVSREIAVHPDRLPLYDDPAVACDRLGRDTEAIAWMDKKRAKLAGTNWKTANPDVREAWYRYYANIGTFRVHRWVRAGADRKKIGEVIHARDEIARAIQIKPNAHFNRERYQLAAMNAIISGEPFFAKVRRELSENLPTKEAGKRNRAFQTRTAQAVEGLSGLIVLGNAWESPDIFGALAEALNAQRKTKVAYMACLRCRELLQAGHVPLTGLMQTDAEKTLRVIAPAHLSGRITNAANVEEKYHVLRNEAGAWQKERTNFEMARLRAGRHPDTDPTFWQGFHDTLPPPLDIAWGREWPGNLTNYLSTAFPLLVAGVFFVAIFGIMGLSVAIIERRRRIYRRTSRPE